MCLDYRALNANTIIDAYPIPHTDNTLDYLGDLVVFSKIKLGKSYCKIRIAKVYKHMTAFLMHFELFEYLVLLFELCNE